MKIAVIAIVIIKENEEAVIDSPSKPCFFSKEYLGKNFNKTFVFPQSPREANTNPYATNVSRVPICSGEKYRGKSIPTLR